MDEPQTVTVRKTYKYKLAPTAEQEQALAFVVRRCRKLYNAGLQERRDAWQKCGVSITAASQSAQLLTIKDVRPEYHDVHSQVLQDVLTRLDRAFAAFFRRVKAGETPGYPRFHGVHRHNSFTYQQFGNGATLDNGFLVLSKIGQLAVRWSRPIEGTPETVTISHEADGWYASVRHFTARIIPGSTGWNSEEVPGSTAYPTPKGERDNSMPIKRSVGKMLYPQGRKTRARWSGRYCSNPNLQRRNTTPAARTSDDGVLPARLNVLALAEPPQEGALGHEPKQGDAKGTYGALGRDVRTEGGMAYGTRVLGSRSPHSSRRSHALPRGAGKLLAGQRGTGPNRLKGQAGEMPISRTEWGGEDWKAGCGKSRTSSLGEGRWKRAIRHLAGGLSYISCAGVPIQPLPTKGQETGIDLGLEAFATLADGSQIANPRIFRVAERNLKRAQRRVSRRKQGSHRRQKAVALLAKAHAKVRRARADFHYKTALALVRQYDTISHEDVQTANMLRNQHLAKSIADAGWRAVLRIFAFKAVCAGKRVVAVPPAYTNQRCSGPQCGIVVYKGLSVR